VRPQYAVIDENGNQLHAAETRTLGQMAIAKEFGISWSELEQRGAKRQSSKSFMAYMSADGRFREIVSASLRPVYRPTK